MECKDCPYYFSDTEEKEVNGTRTVEETTAPYCHYGYNDGGAPCQ